MSATIKYKGNTIATITTDSSKTLKTSGKYCEGDIVVENVQDGGGGKAMVETFCTDNIANQFLSDTWSPSTSAEVLPPAPKYSYNGTILPEIPADVRAQYPMCLIYLRDDGINYRLLAGTKTWYVSGSAIYLEPSTYVVYDATANSGSWVYETQYSDNGNFRIGNGIKWSNHDIPNGSATATEIYFEGSEPVPVEA